MPGKMTKGSRWVWECVAVWPAMGIARLESHGQIRDVNLDDNGQPLDPAWREIVPQPPPDDDDVSDCDDDAFSRPENFPVVHQIDPPFEIEAPNGWKQQGHSFAAHRADHAASPDPSCPFCKGRA